jgi:hypothetical protein
MRMSDAEVEKAIVGVEKLVEVHGWPTPFHDAVVAEVIIDREGPAVTMRLRTNEADIHEGRPRDEVRTSTVMRWHGVEDLQFSGVDDDNWINGMSFSRHGLLMRTDIESQGAFHGFILSKEIEVVSVSEVPPDP